MVTWVSKGTAVAGALLMFPMTGHAGDSLGTTGVTLYEVSERVTFDPDANSAGVIRRNATSPLQGFAALGAPLCPSELLVSVPRIESCTVIATGTDSVSTVTGTGPVDGTFDVVINAPGNSSVRVPDLPVISGTFSGTVDLSLAVLGPYEAPSRSREWRTRRAGTSSRCRRQSSCHSTVPSACRSQSTYMGDP